MAEQESPTPSSPIDEKIIAAVAIDNVKTVAGQPAVLSNLALANAIAHQQAMNQISQAAVGKIVEHIIMVSPTEGAVDVGALQQLMKGAQSTPPVTP